MTYSAEDNAAGSVDGRSTWLENKVEKREEKEGLAKRSMDQRQSNAYEQAEVFLGEMKSRATLRDGIEQKSKMVREREQQILKRQADEYRERLRKYLRPELREDRAG
jgi:hypothetical protein